MQIWDTKTTPEILKSLNAEVAKAQNEIKCANGDIYKAQGQITILSKCNTTFKR